MSSLSHLAYLQALDIPSLVSRRDLPGAAPTRRLQLARKLPATPARAAAPDLAALSADLQRPAATNVPPAEAAAKPAAAVMPSADTPVFSIAATSAGGWFWVDEVPAGREPGEDYAQLLLAICRALGWSQQPAVQECFNYPVAASLAGGVEQAREALMGFLTGRLARLAPAGVVVMGDFKEPWFDRDCLEGQRVVQTVSGWQMLRDPTLKPQAWAALKTLRADD